MKNLHRRVIEFTFFDGDLPMFETNEQAQAWYAAWYAAVGRLVTYALHDQKEIGHYTVDLVQIQVRDKDEMTACYYAPEPAHVKDEHGFTDYTQPQPEYELHKFVCATRERAGLPFVMGAVMSGGKWGGSTREHL